MLVVDLMHEFELGVWKSTFMHIIRVLCAAVPSGDAVVELNKRQALEAVCSAYAEAPNRFRLIPAFGSDTIRRFSNNVSAMKQLAARDFEDLLQVL